MLVSCSMKQRPCCWSRTREVPPLVGGDMWEGPVTCTLAALHVTKSSNFLMRRDKNAACCQLYDSDFSIQNNAAHSLALVVSNMMLATGGFMSAVLVCLSTAVTTACWLSCRTRQPTPFATFWASSSLYCTTWMCRDTTTTTQHGQQHTVSLPHSLTDPDACLSS